jgi:hypothetical protein
VAILEEYDICIIISTSVLSFSMKGMNLSFQRKKQNDASISGSNSMIFLSEKAVFCPKKVYNGKRTLKKYVIYLSETKKLVEITQHSNRFGFSRQKAILLH